MRLLLLVPLLALLAACGGGDDAATAPSEDSLAGSSPTMNDLVVEQDLGDGSAPARWTLVCAGQAEGTHPDPQAACDHLSALDDPFAPLPADQICTEQYGGPQTARITGVWGGEPVDLAVSRTNGCEISQWDSLGPLLPGPVGVELPEEQPQ